MKRPRRRSRSIPAAAHLFATHLIENARAAQHLDGYTSSIVVAQLALWVRLQRGERRSTLQKWLTRLVDAMHGRILGFNVSVAHVWAAQQYQLQAAGPPMPVEDSYIAAIARRHNLIVATGNVQHFKRPGIKVYNPFEETD